VNLVSKLPNPQEMARALVDHAMKNGSMDNITVMIIKFQ
jgi:serine/threonine protein phosphatase PrpC